MLNHFFYLFFENNPDFFVDCLENVEVLAYSFIYIYEFVRISYFE